AARFSLESFETKTNRRRLTGAYSDRSRAVAFFYPVDEETELTLFSTANRAMTFRAGMLDVKATRATQGVQVMVLRAKHTVCRAVRCEDAGLSDNGRYRCRAIPSIGALLKEEDLPNPQLTL
ncbi:MAG: topoisomerase IV, partial [Butyricicoccus sp.]|nr:topoisomerase IV [Butyricicoccus sp.]